MKKGLHYLNEACTMAGSLLYLLITVVCFSQVILRYCFNNAQDWPEELSRFLFIWMAYLGVAYSMYMKSHLKVDVVLLVCGKTLARWIDALGYLISLVFCALVTWQGWIMMGIVIESEEEALSLPIPLYIVWFAIPACFAVTSLYCIRNMYTCITSEDTGV